MSELAAILVGACMPVGVLAMVLYRRLLRSDRLDPRIDRDSLSENAQLQPWDAKQHSLLWKAAPLFVIVVKLVQALFLVTAIVFLIARFLMP